MIGIILRTDKKLKVLKKDWVPKPFSNAELRQALIKSLGYMPTSNAFCYDDGRSLIHFKIDDPEPWAIAFNCVMIKESRSIIQSLAKELCAKVYCSETGDFVELEDV